MKSPSKPSASHRWIAFSLSAFLLPGLGQLHLGFRKSGWFLILSSFSVSIFTLGKFMMGVFKAMDRSHYARPPHLDVLKLLYQAFQAEKVWMFGGLALLLMLWAWGILDVLKKTERD
jgi:hypothetical protein